MFSFRTSGQSYYWIAFTDKNNSPWSILRPEEFLSERALLRRSKQNIPIDTLDLPVNPEYIQQVLKYGVHHIHSSRWLNGITVSTHSSTLPDGIADLSFVKEIRLTKRNLRNWNIREKFNDIPLKESQALSSNLLYGESIYQIAQMNVDYFHTTGFKGTGIHIAVLDAGFSGVDRFTAFDSLRFDNRIIGTRDFVDGEHDVYNDHHHGMNVLSCIAGNIPGGLIGTAPQASYWLLRTEDIKSEYLIEEDYWIAAAEFADSAGVDIINTSLGYTTFDDPAMNYTYSDMDGNTARITQGADIAFSRGILVVASAGNEGRANNSWRYIVAPADGNNVIAVGAIDKNGLPAPFTSLGPASDGRIKPNVAALGWNTIIQQINGSIGAGNGTSFSAPLVTGAAACLWQMNPLATAKEIKQAIEQSANLYNYPDSLLGYGIPDMKIANQKLNTSEQIVVSKNTVWKVYPNPVDDYIILQKLIGTTYDKVQMAFYSLEGKLLRAEEKTDAAKIQITNLQDLPSGVLLLQIRTGNSAEVIKIVRLNGTKTNTF